jgi:acetamidase/formamidase
MVTTYSGTRTGPRGHWAIAGLVLAPILLLVAFRGAAGQSRQADHFVPSRPETVTWGDFPSERRPVLRMKSGETVTINTLSHAGATQNDEPVAFLASMGIPREQVLQDVIDFWSSRQGRPREGRGGHVITGPIYVEGAEPGDVLEVEVLALSTRAPWGINNTSATGGVFANDYPGAMGETPIAMEPARHLIRTGMSRGREVAFFAPNIEVPLQPFMGIMAVAPEYPTVGQPGVTVAGVQSSRPPGPFGGNLDVKDLGVGVKLYLPVFHPGALFYAGDPHSVQGDGEVSGTAIEQSLAGTFRLTVRKGGRRIDGPWAENATHWIMMGIDLDLDRAMRKSVRETVEFLVAEKGLTPAKALSLASIAVDYRVGEAVDLTQVVTGYIPKSLFIGP